ncbi:MAG: transporter substrate-binding domain-containing protein [Bacteroidales bacterium]|nr:transporter substrate-binding domain-containing protein [Bacteroidales bacterium]MBN2748387.1 transporter substrate-binding domain-containing protein [Bacteroidales bacterium]
MEPIFRSDDVNRDLEDIIAKGKLVAVTDFNTTNYFIYKGKPMGYQYEMLQYLAAQLNVKLELVAENNLEKAFQMLEKGEVDLIANNLTITSKRKEKYSFTVPHGQTRQVLVQRKLSEPSDTMLIANPLDLGGKIIYVQEGSASAQRLRNLSDEIGTPIVIVEMPNYQADQLIELVANGDIDYTVCDEDIALVNAAIHGNVDASTAVSFPQNVAWAVRPGANKLLAELDTWLSTFTKTAEYRLIYRRYYDNPRIATMFQSGFLYVRKGKISIYDEDIKSQSSQIDWDWRLLASLIYQESRFNHNVVSHKGAYGLMQFMPATSDYWGIDRDADPYSQLKAGVKYLKWLDEKFIINNVDSSERVKFILAAYNAGIGHVFDARNLARKYGKNPDVWEGNVDYFLLNKSKPEYYKDSVVRFGYCRGEETYNYVKEVMDRYDHYRNIIRP